MKKNTIKYLVYLSITLLTLSCGRDHQAESSEFTQGSIIVGEVDWKEVSTLSSNSSIKKNAMAVADIDLPALGSRCTGFLISESILMTNQHCIPTPYHARGVSVTFDHVEYVNKGQQERYDCSTFIGNNEKLDFALLECQGSPGTKYGFLNLDTSSVSIGKSIYVIQQNCDYYLKRDCDHTKKYSEGKITEVASEYAHSADTLGGSSGSPVFSKSGHKVIAIHHAGLGNNGLGRGLKNYAVPMRLIVPYIQEKFPQVFSSATSTPTTNDNKPSGANKINSFPYSKSSSLSYKNDIDFYTFSSSGRKSISIALSFKHSTGDLDLYLYNSSGKLIAKSNSTSSYEKIYKTLSSGKYFVLVKGYSGAKGSYSLTVK